MRRPPRLYCTHPRARLGKPDAPLPTKSCMPCRSLQLAPADRARSSLGLPPRCVLFRSLDRRRSPRSQRSQYFRVVAGTDPDKHPGLAPKQPVGRDTGVLQGQPCHFQQQTLLWIDRSGFAWADFEKLGVKLIHMVDEARASRVDLALSSRISDHTMHRCQIGPAAPPPLRPDRPPAGAKMCPHRLRRGTAAQDRPGQLRHRAGRWVQP